MKNYVLDRELLEAVSSVQNSRQFLVVTLFDFHITLFERFVEVKTAFFLFVAAARNRSNSHLFVLLLWGRIC